MPNEAHYTLQAKSCVLQRKNEKSSRNLLLFYNVLKKIPMGYAILRFLFLLPDYKM